MIKQVLKEAVNQRLIFRTAFCHEKAFVFITDPSLLFE